MIPSIREALVIERQGDGAPPWLKDLTKEQILAIARGEKPE